MSGGSWWYISHELQFMVLPTGTLLLMTFPTKKCLTHSSNEDKYFTLLSFFSIWVTCSPSSKNWSNILFFLLQLFCFHWELREHILHFHGELVLDKMKSWLTVGKMLPILSQTIEDKHRRHRFGKHFHHRSQPAQSSKPETAPVLSLHHFPVLGSCFFRILPKGSWAARACFQA